MAIARNQQSLIDIALQETGTLEGLVATAVLNNISVTEKLVFGTEIITPTPIVKEIASFLKVRGVFLSVSEPIKLTDYNDLDYNDLDYN